MRDTTLVIGASENPQRYSYKAIEMLKEYGIKTLGLSKRKGLVFDVEILTNISEYSYSNIDTITLYLNPQRQQQYYDYILGLQPIVLEME